MVGLGVFLGGGPWRLVEASGEFGYEEAVIRGRLYTGAVSFGGTVRMSQCLAIKKHTQTTNKRQESCHKLRAGTTNKICCIISFQSDGLALGFCASTGPLVS